MPLLAKVKREDLRTQKDIAYGTDEKQKLDVYAPAKTKGPRPVVVYIHGGGLARGDKDEAGTNDLINSNVPVYFARHGMVGVNVNYRLVPGAVYPSGGEDVAGAVKWVRANIAQYGGDPNAVFLIGHSAGGTVLGTYLYDAKVNNAAPEIAGAIFLSGVIELDKSGPRVGVTKAYYGDDQGGLGLGSTPTQRSTATRASACRPFIINAALDPTEIELPGGVRHYAKLCALDKACPRYFQARNMNHLSTSLSPWQRRRFLLGYYEMRDFIRQTCC